MKIQLIDSRPGFAQAIILKEWMRIGLSICLLGLPVILGYFSIQIAEARNAEFAKNSSPTALGDGFDFSAQSPALQNTTPDTGVLAVQSLVRRPSANKPSGFDNQVASEKLLPSQREYWSQPDHNEQDNTLAKIQHQATVIFARYGDVLKKGHIVILAAAIAYPPAINTGFAPHKNGRIVDPAAYIHSTIR